MTTVETKLIERIKAITTKDAASELLLTGIGDDTAVLARPRGPLLFAADMLMDGTHFDLPGTAPELIGRKALAVNLSDIAAMGGTPLAVTVSIAVPAAIDPSIPVRIMTGMQTLAREFGVTICGGDTNVWQHPLVIDVAIIGETHPKGPVLRSGAKAGDRIIVTGPLGLSISGHHLRFQPKVIEAKYLHDTYTLHSMIDISDGLAKDLRHILQQSSCGATLNRNHLPRNRHAAGTACTIEQALSDGEDFELCFTLSPEEAARALHDKSYPGSILYDIGFITAEPGLRFEDGSEILTAGYEHGVKPNNG